MLFIVLRISQLVPHKWYLVNMDHCTALESMNRAVLVQQGFPTHSQKTSNVHDPFMYFPDSGICVQISRDAIFEIENYDEVSRIPAQVSVLIIDVVRFISNILTDC